MDHITKRGGHVYKVLVREGEMCIPNFQGCSMHLGTSFCAILPSDSFPLLPEEVHK